ncbi:MAG: hypothetical protein ACKO2V_08335 [Snowella sp.]
MRSPDELRSPCAKTWHLERRSRSDIPQIKSFSPHHPLTPFQMIDRNKKTLYPLCLCGFY